MFTDLDDLKSLRTVTLSSKETPLPKLVEQIKANPGRYILKRSTLYQSHWLIWDTTAKEYLIATYAFAVRHASHPATGNFVPPGQKAPEGLAESQIKSEPGPYAQISITFDARLDESLHEYLSVIETWAKADPNFITTGRARNPWMSPISVANNGKYMVTSPLFIGKTTFNSKEDGIQVNYQVHPWVAQASIDEPTWLPNPNLVRMLHLNADRTLEDLASTSKPDLDLGDIIKMTFKFVFTSYGQYWNMTCSPIQAIRMGQLDKSAYGGIVNLEDNGKLDLPKAGERLPDFLAAMPINSGLQPSLRKDPLERFTVNRKSSYLSDRTAVGLGPILETDREVVEDGLISWGSLTPISERSVSESRDNERLEGQGDQPLIPGNLITRLAISAEELINDIIAEGKPMHSGESDPPANSTDVTTGKGKKRAASGTTSKKTRTVKARTAL